MDRRPVLFREHHRGAHPGQFAQGGSTSPDSTRKSAHLELVVAAAENLQGPVASTGPGPVRYIRSPGAAGSGRSGRGQPGRPRYDVPTPAPTQ
ncbi:hypothetical protein [Streptomyces thioluteus]|uniref:hypothetical protein n=1 Tax=Streptomyces thioluteus TaxID=66431 RepID=UPI0031E671F5